MSRALRSNSVWLLVCVLSAVAGFTFVRADGPPIGQPYCEWNIDQATQSCQVQQGAKICWSTYPCVPADCAGDPWTYINPQNTNCQIILSWTGNCCYGGGPQP